MAAARHKGVHVLAGGWAVIDIGFPAGQELLGALPARLFVVVLGLGVVKGILAVEIAVGAEIDGQHFGIAESPVVAHIHGGVLNVALVVATQRAEILQIVERKEQRIAD